MAEPTDPLNPGADRQADELFDEQGQPTYSKPIDPLKRRLSPTGLYSHAADVVAKMPQMIGTPAQFKAMMLKQGVKPDELKHSNYDAAFANKPKISKLELKQHFDRTLPKIQESQHGGEDDSDPLPKYGDYQLPGGKNYRELVMHLPENAEVLAKKRALEQRMINAQRAVPDSMEALRRAHEEFPRTHPDVRAAAKRYTEAYAASEDAVAALNAHNAAHSGTDFKSSHWEEPNVVAHLRMSDRPYSMAKGEHDADGNRRTNQKALHLEELQSDWAQQGREKGFKQTQPSYWVRNTRSGHASPFFDTMDEASAYQQQLPENVRSSTVISQRPKTTGDVVPGPYVDSTSKWTDLGLKRALYEAAKGGYSKLLITPGEEQAKRYSLERHVKRIAYDRDGHLLFVTDHQGNRHDQEGIKPEELPQHVGHEVAQKLLAQPKQGTLQALDGLDLKVGGEGMKGFYDKIVPTQLEKLAKKHDPEAKVKLFDHAIEGDNPLSKTHDNWEAFRTWLYNHPVHGPRYANRDQGHAHEIFSGRGSDSYIRNEYVAKRPKTMLHSLDITPKMRESILQGMPAYQAGGRVGFKEGGSPMLEPGATEPDEELDPNYQAPSIGRLIRRGQPLQPKTPMPTPEQLRAARADTRTGGDIVNQRLNTIVPEHERVAGGTYTPGAPGGGRWADATIAKRHMRPKQTGADPFQLRDDSEMVPTTKHEKLVDQPGHGFKSLKDEDLDKLWHHSVAESSMAARKAVAEHGVHPTFNAKDWHEAMSLPLRDHLWYELSGEKMAENLPDLSPSEHMKTLDVLGATSARAPPGENLDRTLATMSQHLRGAPVDIDLTQPPAVNAALARKHHDTSALPGNKTGHFSDTLALAGGVPTRFPISVNDVWVGKMFGVPDNVMTQHQSLHEPMAKYFNKLRDLYNERHGHELPFKYQSWNFQAPAWVHLRNKEAGNESGDAYHQVWSNTISKLKAAGVQGIEGDKITRKALMDPRFADALRRKAAAFRDAPKATVEFGTTQTPVGKQAHELYHQAIERGDKLSQHEYTKGLTSAMYASARGENHPWDRLKKAITGDLTKDSDITRIMHPTSEAPFDVGGTFEGAVSPNIRVPLKGMNDQHLAEFNAIAGRHLKQDAMAVSHVLGAEKDSVPREGYTRGHSIFVPTTNQIHPDEIRAFAKELAPHGHDMSYVRYPNGYHFDVLPAFGENDTMKGVPEKLLDEAYGKTLKHSYGTGTIAAHDFKSVYTPADKYGKTRAALTKRIRDEYVRQTGLPREEALRALEAPEAGLSRGSKEARDVYKQRLDHLAGAEQGFKELAQKVRGAHTTFIEKATKRAAKPPKPVDPDAPPFARGGAIVDDDVVERALELVKEPVKDPPPEEREPAPKDDRIDKLAEMFGTLVDVVTKQNKHIKELVKTLQTPQVVERDANHRVVEIRRKGLH